MIRFFYYLARYLVPRRLKDAVIYKIRMICKQEYSEEWANSTLIPLDQKISRLEASINRINALVNERNLIEEWVNHSLIPLEQKIERLDAQFREINELKSHLENVDYIGQWVEKSLIPIEQKVERLNSDIRKNSAIVEKIQQMDFVNDLLKKYIEPIEEKVKRLNAQMATKQLLSENVDNIFKVLNDNPVEEILSRQGRSIIQIENKLERFKYKQKDAHVLDESIDELCRTNSNVFLSEEEYVDFEKKFHVNFEDTDENYKKLLLSSLKQNDKVVEIGCGTGDLLRYIKDNVQPIEILGIDNNQHMVDSAIKAGVNAICGDALKTLEKQNSESVNSIFAIHIIEHLPLSYLRSVIYEIHRILQSGGRLYIETPNTQSLYVMSHYYYVDTTHQSPRHPSLLTYLLKSIGFKEVTLHFTGSPPDELIMSRCLNRDNELCDDLDRMAIKFNQLFFSSGNNIVLEVVK